MAIQFADIDDAVIATQEHLVKKGAFLDLQTDLSDHVAVRELWKGRRKVFDGGDDWQFQAQIDHNHSARAVSLFETDGSSVTDTLVEGYMRPRHVNAHYIYDQREKAFQRGGKAIVDLVYSRYVAMMVSFYEKMEEFLWGSPSATDNKTPHGVSFWVQKCASGENGFKGVDPSGYEAIGRAHILTSANARWVNWASDYAAVSKEDLIRKMREASMKTRFRSPVSHSQPDVGGMGNGIYANYNTVSLMEEILETQNMNLGNDVASKDGKTVFKGTPLTYVPKLDADDTDPVYMLDWKKLAVGVLAGWENQLSKPYMVPNKSKVRRIDLDCSFEMICTDLRRQAVFSKVA